MIVLNWRITMDKLTMAHDWAMKHGSPDNFKLTVDEAWEYADAMQAEADKRINTDRPDIFTKDMHGNCRHMHKTLHGAECFDCGEALNLSNSKPLESALHNIDCYFDKTDNTQRDANNLIQWIYERLSGEVLNLSDWQPDWSVAPVECKYWAMDADNSAYFFKREPEITNGNGWDFGGLMQSNEGHDYQGDWEDSLRERPKQHACNCAHWKGDQTFQGDTFTCKDCGGSVTI